MTKEEAYAAMLAGKKITHEFFTSNEYLHIVNGRIMAEDGVLFDDEWRYRDGEAIWRNGWSVKDE